MAKDTLPQSLKTHIYRQNGRNLLISVAFLVCIDSLFLAIAKMDHEYPSNPDLLDLMQINVGMGIILFISLFLYYRKTPELFHLAVPLIACGLKLMYTMTMSFDVNLLLYYMGIYVILCMVLLTHWEMIAVGALYQGMILLLLWNGYLHSVSDGYAVVVITSVVVGISAMWNASRFKQYIENFTHREALLEQKQAIEQLMKTRELALDINHKLITHRKLDDYFDYILRSVVHMTNKATAACILLDEEGYLKAQSYYNYDDSIKTFKIRKENSFAYKMQATGSNQPVIINDIEDLMEEGFPDLVLSADGKAIRSSLTTPLIMENQFYGLLNLDSAENYIFDESDIHMMNYIGEQVSIVLENHMLYSKIAELSLYDQLTGFYNRWYLKDIKEHHYPLWCREQQAVYIAIFDLDNLKHVNDNFGHDQGDTYIRNFCKLLEEAFRKSDIFIRNGGDEFLGIFFSIHSEELYEKLEQVRQVFSESVYENEAIYIESSFSYGIVRLKCKEENIEQAIKRADQKMYEHKNRYRKEVYKDRRG